MRGLKEVMTGKSEEGLMDYLVNYNRYTAEAIEAALDELKRRGKNFTDEEAKGIQIKIEARKQADHEDDNPFSKSDSWKRNVVLNPDAPLLYSKGAIRGFSMFFSTIFGAVLLAINIEHGKGKWIVAVFGILYTSLSILILNVIPVNT